MKLLIVDDEKYICSSLNNGFDWHSLGFDEVFSASRVSEALDIVDTNKIGIIITDIKMPKLSGIDLIKEISSRSPDTKIIIISGYDKFEYAQTALKFGVTDYLLKPARIEDVVEAVKKAIGLILGNVPGKYKNVLIKDFLCNLIFRHITDINQIQKSFDEYRLDILKSEFLMVILNYNLKNNFDAEINDIINVITNHLKSKFGFVIFDDNHEHIVMLAEATVSKEIIYDMCNDCCAAVGNHFGISDFKGVIGRNIKDIAEISGIYHETVQIADRFILSGKDRVFFVNDIENVRTYNIVYTAKKYVCDHIYENITIQTISDMIYITPGYFSLIFRTVTGESFVKYVNTQKMEKAKSLLETEEIPVSAIAETIGFDVKYFNRVFKKYTGLTPNEFRKCDKGKDVSFGY